MKIVYHWVHSFFKLIINLSSHNAHVIFLISYGCVAFGVSKFQGGVSTIVLDGHCKG